MGALFERGLDPVVAPRRIGRLVAVSGVRLPRLGREPVIVPMMGPRFELLHAARLRGIPIPFAWDVWEPDWEAWVEHLKHVEAPLVMTTARQSAQYLATQLDGAEVVWMPEAIDPRPYQAGRQLSERSTDVLELGRGSAAWHSSVSERLESEGRRHLYQKQDGSLVFNSRSDLYAGLADAKLSICFPSSSTHPLRSGSVNTMTMRYLESFASRCLVLGESPEELSDLFGFDPVIHVEPGNEAEQVERILASVGQLQGLADRARKRTLEVGTWETRANAILAVLSSAFSRN